MSSQIILSDGLRTLSARFERKQKITPENGSPFNCSFTSAASVHSEIMLPRHVRYHRARCDRLGNNPPLLLIAPPSAADNARYFCVAPNNLRVVTNVDHDVHTILDPNRTAIGHCSQSLSYVG